MKRSRPDRKRCGRSPVVAGEGRQADGSWAADEYLPDDAKDAWFCSYNCYDLALRDHRRTLQSCT